VAELGRRSFFEGRGFFDTVLDDARLLSAARVRSARQKRTSSVRIALAGEPPHNFNGAPRWMTHPAHDRKPVIGAGIRPQSATKLMRDACCVGTSTEFPN
jgi:hypothetical protein